MFGLFLFELNRRAKVERGPPIVAGRNVQPFFLIIFLQFLPEKVVLPLELLNFHEVAFVLIELAGRIRETVIALMRKLVEFIDAEGGVDDGGGRDVVFHIDFGYYIL